MEKVLAHFRQHPSDSLKYRAAVFLITNMPGQYSYKNTDYVQSYYDELSNGVSLDFDNLTNMTVIEDISAKYNGYSNVAELYFYQQGNEKPVYGEITGLTIYRIRRAGMVMKLRRAIRTSYYIGTTSRHQ